MIHIMIIYVKTLIKTLFEGNNRSVIFVIKRITLILSRQVHQNMSVIVLLAVYLIGKSFYSILL